MRRAFRGLKQVLGEESLSAVKKKAVDLNTVKARRRPLSPEFRAELVETFRDEVAQLSRLMKRDLSHWV